MYFWNIEALKTKLRTTGLTETQTFYYFLISTLLYTLGMTSETESVLYFFVTIALTVAGYYYTFISNGGAQGTQYLAKITSLSFVYGIRFFVLTVLPFALVMGFLWSYSAAQGNSAELSTLDSALLWAEIVVPTLLVIFYFWRLGKHVKDTTVEITSQQEQVAK